MFVPINPLFLLGPTYISAPPSPTSSSSTSLSIIFPTLIHHHGPVPRSPLPEVDKIDVAPDPLPLPSTPPFSLSVLPPTSNSSPTPKLAIPSSLLTQLPQNWPYTTHGVGRNAGQTTAYHLTAPDSDGTNQRGKVVGVVVASLQWFPRPLGRQRGLDVGGGGGGAGRIEEPGRTAIPETTKATATGAETVLPIGSATLWIPTTSEVPVQPTASPSAPSTLPSYLPPPSSPLAPTSPPYSAPPPPESPTSTTFKPTVILTGLRPPNLDPTDPAHSTSPLDPATTTSSGRYASMFTLP